MLLLISVAIVFLVIFIVPVVVYGLAHRFADIPMPDEKSPLTFLAGVGIEKTGTALAFVFIFYSGIEIFSEKWVYYAGIWWLMFVLGEVGKSIASAYSWKEAAAGIISEGIYFPVAALLIRLILIP